MAGDMHEMKNEPSLAAKQADSTKTMQKLIQRIFKMRTAVSRLSSDVGKVGGPNDTLELRKKVQDAISSVQKEAASIKDDLFNVVPEQKNRQSAKLVSDFEACLKDFQATMKTAKSKESASLPRQPQASISRPLDLEEGGGANERTNLLQQEQQQAQKQEEMISFHELEYNTALIEEREQGVQEIQQDISQVNEMFQDLAVLVHDQGLQLDTIDSNITRVADSTHTAGGELRRAEQYQRSARNRMCYILVVVAIVMAILVIVLVA